MTKTRLESVLAAFLMLLCTTTDETSFCASFLLPRSSSHRPPRITTATTTWSSTSSFADFDEARLAASGLLYQDMQNARGRAAIKEGELLQDRITELEVPLEATLEGAATVPLPKVLGPVVLTQSKQSKGGAGFGGGGGFGGAGGSKTKNKKNKKQQQQTRMKATPPTLATRARRGETLTPKQKQTLHQVSTLSRDGCLRINGALSKETATRVRACILREIKNSQEAVAANPENIVEIHAQHGIDQERTNRCVINLPLRGDRIKGYAEACTDVDPTFDSSSSDPITEALQQLLDPTNGALGPLYAELCGYDAPLYELCSLVTWPGSLRQSVHPDAAHQPHAPLYAAFCACQDITVEMGPTLFLPGTHLPTGERAKFDDMSTRNDMIANYATPKLATLKAGDLAIFDMRCLHVGSANDSEKGDTRVLFNVTFRNPKADKNLIGYEGSIRKPYLDQLTLDTMQKELSSAKAFVDWP